MRKKYLILFKKNDPYFLLKILKNFLLIFIIIIKNKNQD